MQGNMQVAQNVFQSSMQQFQQQTQAAQQMSRTLSEQSQSQQPAVQTPVQESTNMYSDFLNTTMSFYQQGMQAWAQAAQQGMQAVPARPRNRDRTGHQPGRPAVESTGSPERFLR
jgi:hypothetical protein